MDEAPSTGVAWKRGRGRKMREKRSGKGRERCGRKFQRKDKKARERDRLVRAEREQRRDNEGVIYSEVRARARAKKTRGESSREERKAKWNSKL